MFKKTTIHNPIVAMLRPALIATGFIVAGLSSANSQEMANACPVEGCDVKITQVELVDGELAVKFEANFQPDFSKNHLHIWWGDKYTIEQVSGNAETVHKVKQGEWHPTDIYPDYTTQGIVSTAVRDGSKTLCVSAADRSHDILDTKVFYCEDVSALF